MLNKKLTAVLLLALLSVNTVKAQVTYVHEDFMGSVAAESNVLGQITKRSHFEPYGEQRSSTISNEAAYTGHVFDDDLDLSYMGARYYDSSIGRFYSDDPVGFLSDNPASFNRYAYANNNPFAYKDPNGELPVLIIPIIVFIAKEVAATAAETAIESATGVAVPLSTKSLVKSAGKQVASQASKNSAKNASSGGADIVYRRGVDPESPTRLNRKAQEAEASNINIHGVSASRTKVGECSAATCADLEKAGFRVHKTRTRNDANHVTIELPKPVTKQDADRFNYAFGRDVKPGGASSFSNSTINKHNRNQSNKQD